MSDEERATVFLKPGELLVAPAPTVVTTLLGSCVAITMFSASHRIGAICHALLPACRSKVPCTRVQEREGGKYVECAARLMLERLAAHGVARGEIEAKIFGGADMFDSEGGNASIGKQNIEMALRMLEAASVRLATCDLGGRRGRKIVFDTATGEVFLKRLRKTET